MQRNNGAGGSLEKIIESIYIEFYNSFYNSLSKTVTIITVSAYTKS